jgi:hypothetical protein
MSSRQQPTRSIARLADLMLIVRPPGNPGGIRAFTEAERAEADAYAAETGATVEPIN